MACRRVAGDRVGIISGPDALLNRQRLQVEGDRLPLPTIVGKALARRARNRDAVGSSLNSLDAADQLAGPGVDHGDLVAVGYIDSAAFGIGDHVIPRGRIAERDHSCRLVSGRGRGAAG